MYFNNKSVLICVLLHFRKKYIFNINFYFLIIIALYNKYKIMNSAICYIILTKVLQQKIFFIKVFIYLVFYNN